MIAREEEETAERVSGRTLLSYDYARTIRREEKNEERLISLLRFFFYKCECFFSSLHSFRKHVYEFSNNNAIDCN